MGRSLALAERPLDCTGVVQGKTSFDSCDVCGGDNATCSGCDGIPNVRQDGINLDRGCSGHGQCKGGLQCACCADNLYLVSEKNGAKEQQRCPWFGIMCHRFCTRSPVNNIEGQMKAVQNIHCNGHGQCIQPNNAVQCACDDGWTNGKDGALCGFKIPVKTKAMDPILRRFIEIGVPIISVALLLAFYVWIRAFLKARQVKLGQRLVEELVLNKLPLPTVEEVGDDVVTERETIKDRSKEKNVEEEIEHFYKEEALLKIKAKRSKLARGDKIDFNLDDFHYNDAGKEIPDSSVSAFLASGKFDKKKMQEATGHDGVLQALSRLEKFKTGPGQDAEGTEALWQDKNRIKDLLRAGARVPRSKSKPQGAGGVMPIVEGSKALVQQVHAQQRQVQALGGRTLPEFLKDAQMEQFQRNPDPIQLGKLVGDDSPKVDGVFLLKGDTDGSPANESHAQSTQKAVLDERPQTSLWPRFLQLKKRRDDEEGEEGLEVMV